MVNDSFATKAIFTIITKSHLAYARSVAAHLEKLHPGLRFYAFLADQPDDCFDSGGEPFEMVLLDEYLPREFLDTMPVYYTPYEFSNALKPFAHLHLAGRSDLECWFYLDADTYVCGRFHEVFEALGSTSILLTPHISKPAILSQTEDLERAFLQAGIFNGGFLGIRKSEVAMRFLEWWKDRLVWLCLHAEPGLEVDQSWLNFVPVIFDDVLVFRDPSVNVAYWNLHERRLCLAADGSIEVEGRKVVFVHISGWDWREPGRLSRHTTAGAGASEEAWRSVIEKYREALLAAGIETTSAWSNSFSNALNGQPLTHHMRRSFRDRLRMTPDKSSVRSPRIAPEDYAEKEIEPMGIYPSFRIFLGALKRQIQESFFTLRGQ